jgi:hypothetical protein
MDYALDRRVLRVETASLNCSLSSKVHPYNPQQRRVVHCRNENLAGAKMPESAGFGLKRVISLKRELLELPEQAQKQSS